MPGTAHGVADHEALGERTVVVRAMGADREQLRAAPHQQDLVVADMTEQLSAVGEVCSRQCPAPDRGRRIWLGLEPFTSPLAL